MANRDPIPASFGFSITTGFPCCGFRSDPAEYLSISSPVLTRDLKVLDCSGCGACCTRMGHPPFHWQGGAFAEDVDRWARMPESLRLEVTEHIETRRGEDFGECCIWFDPDTRRCRHYEYRPQVCRNFEVGNPHCVRMRIEQGIAIPSEHD